MPKLLLIARQEFKMTAANKAFIIITIIGPFLILAVSVLPTFLATNPSTFESEVTVGVVGVEPDLYQQLSRSLAGVGVYTESGAGFEAYRQKVQDGEMKGIVMFPDEISSDTPIRYYSKTGTDAYVFETLRGVLTNVIVGRRLEGAGLDPARVERLSSPPAMVSGKLGETMKEAGSGGQDFGSIILTALSFVLLLYMTVLLYGQMIGRAVIREKMSKTVEIMLSSATPKEMMFGKILGIGFAGILQYAFWIAMAAVLIQVIGPIFDLTLPKGLNSANLGFLVLFFICAYFLYASAYAALGAGAEDEQHLGQLAWPLIVFLVIPLMMITPLVMNPDTLLIKILSFFPMTAPIVMLTRVLVDMPPLWELFLCFAILGVTIYLFVVLSAKIFRTGILMTGKRPRIGEILRWVKG